MSEFYVLNDIRQVKLLNFMFSMILVHKIYGFCIFNTLQDTLFVRKTYPATFNIFLENLFLHFSTYVSSVSSGTLSTCLRRLCPWRAKLDDVRGEWQAKLDGDRRVLSA